jgi:DeoR family transcriptional regulator of aga operon
MPILAEERRSQILELLQANGFVRTGELTQQFDVSDVTLRSDLQELERRGRLVRTRGGAVSSMNDVGRSSFDARMNRNRTAKQRIALAAAQFIQSDSTVIFDAGTTTLALAHHLPAVSGLTVVTPALNTAQHLLTVDGTKVVVMGGPVDPDTVSSLWPVAQPAEDEGGVHVTFLGCHGIDADFDLVDVSATTASAKRRLIRAGRRVVLLADASKFGTRAASKVGPLSLIDVLITDDAVAPAIADEIRSAGVDLLVV